MGTNKICIEMQCLHLSLIVCCVHSTTGQAVEGLKAELFIL